jgi:hypothetical protein
MEKRRGYSIENAVGDLLALAYFVLFILCATYFFRERFETLVNTHPYFMGFIKVSFLATFGEYLKLRISSGRWVFDSFREFILRFIVWGLFGVWFTIIFPLFSFATESLISAGYWPGGSPLWVAFSKSLFLNVIGCYGWPMMVLHEYFNLCIERMKFVPGWEFGKHLDPKVWYDFIPKTILFFWVPAQTFTYSLPPQFRVLSAAALAVILGFLLTIRKPKE